MTTPRPGQAERAAAFRALHERPGAFVIANCWDGGSARALAGLGFAALATSSGAAAGVLGRRDGQIGRDEALEQIRGIVAAVDLPLAGDLEQGYGDDPRTVADTIRLAAAAGLVGGSIEDYTGRGDELYPVEQAAERVAAAVQAARALPFPFTLTARAEGLLHGQPDLEAVVRRLQAYEKAGADVLFAPGLPSLEAVATVCRSVSRPVNFMAGIRGRSFSVRELEAAGVKRVSLATSLYRAAMTGLIEAAREVRESGTFGYLDRALSSADLAAAMKV